MSPTETKEKILQGTKLAVERLLAKKHQTNSYVVVSQNGKVVQLKA